MSIKILDVLCVFIYRHLLIEHYYFSDFQILSIEMPRSIQEEEESQKDQMDKSLQENSWQGLGGGSVIRV